jgi:hypothetical protein
VSTETLERLDALLAEAGEADDALRAVVELLASEPEIEWAGIAFLEEGELVLGPAAGVPDETARQSAVVAFHGEPVGELRIDGRTDAVFLEQVAARIAELVLVGWDTRGEAWEP